MAKYEIEVSVLHRVIVDAEDKFFAFDEMYNMSEEDILASEVICIDRDYDHELPRLIDKPRR